MSVANPISGGISRMSGGARFRDRREAGRALAHELRKLTPEDPIVVALPRGGVPVGYEVAKALGAPLDIALVRKLGAPMQPELGIGALGESGEAILDTATAARLGVTREQLAQIVREEQRELERRRIRYRRGEGPLEVADRLVVLVDDGLATGVTAVAAARDLKARGAREVMLAVPVCPEGSQQRMGSEFDRLLCLRSPVPFHGVGGAYEDFSPTPDEEVVQLLDASRQRGAGPAHAPAQAAGDGPAVETPIEIRVDPGVRLAGTLTRPADSAGLVIFVHGSGSSRHSPRNRAVAAALNRAGCATLLFDLLTEAESRDRANVFDIELLSRRLTAASRWAREEPGLLGLPIGYFGASTGAAAALRAAANRDAAVAAIVSRGGRPDLAGASLRRVAAPTLLIVGGADTEVLRLNRTAAAQLAGRCELAVVPGAGHLFEGPGELEDVARLAAEWFQHHFAGAHAAATGEAATA
jgi:putative phosphoribosyl transferase